MAYVNQCKKTGKYLFKKDGMRLLRDDPRQADVYDSKEEARDAGEHWGKQPYVPVDVRSARLRFSQANGY